MITHDDYQDLASRAKRKMMNDWELGIKRSFKIDEPEDEKWHVDIPGYLGIHVPEPQVADPDRGLPEGFSSHRTLSAMRGKSLWLSNDSLNRVDPGTLVLKTQVIRIPRPPFNLAYMNRGHLSAIFSKVCEKITHLVSTQISVAESREGKKAAVGAIIVSLHSCTNVIRQFFLSVVSGRISICGRSLREASTMLRFSNRIKRQSSRPNCFEVIS
jgi:hypothetical protein